MSIPNSKILSQVVSEKSLTEKKFINRQTNIVTEKAKTLYPLYTLYAGGILILWQVYRQLIFFWGGGGGGGGDGGDNFL